MKNIRLHITQQKVKIALGLTAVAMMGCEPPSSEIVALNDTIAVVDTPASENGADPNKTICDPFANNPNRVGANLDLGIVGQITYLTDDMPRFSTAQEYSDYGVKLDATLFLNDIFVKTRSFDLGFVTQSGQVLKNHKGEELYEYFGIQMDTELRLGPDDQVGQYQLAILSDDGALLDVKTGSEFETIVNNDGTHSTRMGCATKPIRMDLNSSIPTHIKYYQGPRYHIAMTVLWRPWPENDPNFQPNDPLCGKSGNNYFFDYTKVPSVPTAKFDELTARGWKVLTQENYALPRSITSNPCKEPDPVRTFITTTSPASIRTNQTAFSATFRSNYQVVTYQCSLDGATRVPCTSPVSYTGLGEGSHDLRVWATDLDGRTDELGASYAWTIDLSAPSAINGNAVSTTNSVTITWTTSEPSTTKLLWGPTTATSNVVAEDFIYKTQHSVTLNNLSPDTAYYYRFAGRDSVGNSFTSNRLGFLTKP